MKKITIYAIYCLIASIVCFGAVEISKCYFVKTYEKGEVVKVYNGFFNGEIGIIVDKRGPMRYIVNINGQDFEIDSGEIKR